MNTKTPSHPAPQLWGGIECTINRVGDDYNDQLARNGHAARLEDLDLFAGLGIRALRYPVLWERFAGENNMGDCDWSWADARMARLRGLNIRPIVGLTHHGSGPIHTSLISPDFADGLAAHARRVACRYPWVEDYTPVNEPLTTARFSGLYGHWYPHGTDEPCFARAVINQCWAVARSMQAIREINPAARLIQTDDLGKTYSTPHMRYQADFENERRWLTWDLLCGKINCHHRMWGHLIGCGIGERELAWFQENPCPPNVLGINHYLTSERFLDERRERYPSHTHAGNGRDRYADVEAVRALAEGVGGIRGILAEAWERYHLPIAITEAHLGCTREEQMRWLWDVWQAAAEACEQGIDIQAVTVWALLGSYDWDSLLTQCRGHYEPGVFDVRGGHPRPTALAGLMRQLAKGQKPDHPVMSAQGWWREPLRLLYPAEDWSLEQLNREQQQRELKTAASDGEESASDKQNEQREAMKPAPLVKRRSRFKEARPLLITGAAGTLGYAFARLCHMRRIPHVALSRPDMDITDVSSAEAQLERHRPWAVINAAGYMDLDRAEGDEEHCYQTNTAGPALLAAECKRLNIPLLTFSSDLVFNGRKTAPYVESDLPTPMNVYGRSKGKAEKLVREIMPDALIVRASALFSPWNGCNFVASALRALAEDDSFVAVNDAVVSPTYAPDLVHACLDLLIDGATGVWHLANAGAVTWEQLARMAAEKAGIDVATLQACPTRDLRLTARRPLYTVLGTERGQILQPLEDALDCYLRDCGINWLALQSAQRLSTPEYRLFQTLT